MRMDTLHIVMRKLEEYLNNEPVLQRRNAHIKSTIKDGKDLVELDIQGTDAGTFTIQVKGKKFLVRTGAATVPLLTWSVPLALFKDVLLGKVKILYTMLDPSCTLTFDSPNFTHWNGITALAVILMAQEMVKKNPELKQMVATI